MLKINKNQDSHVKFEEAHDLDFLVRQYIYKKKLVGCLVENLDSSFIYFDTNYLVVIL